MPACYFYQFAHNDWSSCSSSGVFFCDFYPTLSNLLITFSSNSFYFFYRLKYNEYALPGVCPFFPYFFIYILLLCTLVQFKNCLIKAGLSFSVIIFLQQFSSLLWYCAFCLICYFFSNVLFFSFFKKNPFCVG